MNIFGFITLDAITGILASAMFGIFFGFLFGFIRYIMLEPITGNKGMDLIGKGVTKHELEN
jgi:hypothetical protein